jgi:hypothetical protein
VLRRRQAFGGRWKFCDFVFWWPKNFLPQKHQNTMNGEAVKEGKHKDLRNLSQIFNA